MKLRRFIYRFNESYSGIRKGILYLIENLFLFISFLGLISIIYLFGFDLDERLRVGINMVFNLIVDVFFVFIFIRIVLNIGKNRKKQALFFDILLFLILCSIVIERYIFPQWLEKNLPVLHFLKENVIIYLIIISVFVTELSKQSLFIFLGKLNPALLFVISFVFLIIIGTGLLLLPNSTVNGISFVDALFTSTSAVCVTGLITVDTALTYTAMGKTILLVLIQLGGLGVMTFTTFFGIFFSGNNSFRNNLFIKDMINNDTLSDIFNNLMKIVLFTFVIEFFGALIIYMNIDRTVFIDEYSNMRFSIFHSISAFCNAGFSTLSQGLYDIRFRFNYPVHLIIAFLVILGGIGFPILLNYYKLLKHYTNNIFNKLRGKLFVHKPNIINVNTRIVIYSTIILLVFGTIVFYFTERNNSFKEHSVWGQMVESFFASVTPRTAGFNTIDYSNIMPITILFTIFLMWVGASPGSTGGGIKTSSFAIAILNVFSLSKGKDRLEIWRREIADDSLRKAFAIILLSLLAIGLSIILVSAFDPKFGIEKIAFECFSAFGTVGLTMGITPELSVASKYVLVFTMFLGRVGTLTLFVVFIKKVISLKYKFPEENIIIN